MKQKRALILEEINSLYNECGSMIDSVVEVCERKGVELESIVQYIRYSKEMRAIIEKEGIALRMLEA